MSGAPPDPDNPDSIEPMPEHISNLIMAKLTGLDPLVIRDLPFEYKQSIMSVFSAVDRATHLAAKRAADLPDMD